MDKDIKRVAAVHDLSGFGRASLTVIIPVLSTMGLQVCPVPTALLSTHTGGFDGYCFIDLTDHLENYVDHWHRLGLNFDCIYTGFLGSPRQISIISSFIETFSANSPLIVIDPVLGDNGCLYSAMNEKMVQEMRQFVRKADIITPNFTEAAFLLDEPYRLDVDEAEMKDWLYRLSAMGPKTAVISSVPNRECPGKIGVVAYDGQEDSFFKTDCDYIPAHYPGVGDIFASVIVGSILQGTGLPAAVRRAVRFMSLAISTSYDVKYPKRYGVLLESVLGHLRMQEDSLKDGE